MDRLPHLTAAGLLALSALTTTSCGGDDPGAAPMARRVDAVPAAPKAAVDLDDFCEVRPEPANAPRFAWPELTEPPPPSGGGWTWVNVWATWCGPCVEELPMILGWPQALSETAAPVQLRLLSVDDSDSAIDRFRKKNDWLPASLRSSRAEGVKGWLDEIGLELPAVLPLHIFVDPQGRVRCGRSGALHRDAREAIEALIEAG